MLLLMITAVRKKPIWQQFPAFRSESRADIPLRFAYLLVQLIDLGLTHVAVNMGLTELNPLLNGILGSPFKLLAVKFLIPLLIAVLVPGKLLIPGILFLVLIVILDIQQLVLFFL